MPAPLHLWYLQVETERVLGAGIHPSFPNGADNLPWGNFSCSGPCPQHRSSPRGKSYCCRPAWMLPSCCFCNTRLCFKLLVYSTCKVTFQQHSGSPLNNAEFSKNGWLQIIHKNLLAAVPLSENWIVTGYLGSLPVQTLVLRDVLCLQKAP